MWVGPLGQTLWIYSHKYYDLTVTINVIYGHTLCDYEDNNYFLTNSLIIFIFYFVFFVFTSMSSFIVFVKYNDCWGENNVYTCK